MIPFAFMAPILPGQLETWRRFNQETLGTWGEAHARTNERAGITVERAWLQQTPMGDFAIIYMEAEDPSRIFEQLATSNDPYAAWFSEQVLAIHGLDLSQPAAGLPSTLEMDWRAQPQQEAV
jgi:hypothetical protein